ncbi:hypothetical protein BC332_03354 [Capsicum chinense]|nr:hypothetical protein BC332_03354 [Capsicum chinense]
MGGDPKCWKWRSFTKVTLPIPVRHNSSYNKFVASVMQRWDLDCALSNVVISYLIHLREKVNPTIINNNVRVLAYIMDTNADGFRPILRINVVKRSFEELLNSSPPPSRRLVVDDDLNNYENDGDHPINMHIRIANAFSHVYSRSHHELCMRFLAEILQINQHCGEHLYLFYATAKAYSFDEFSKNFTGLKKNCPEAAHILENMVGFEKWCRAHFPGNRKDPKDSKSVSDSLYVTNPNRVLDKYMMFGNSVTAKVNILERSCSCRKFDLVKISCEHVMAALRAKYGNDVGYGNSIYEYSSSIYKAESYLLAYSKAINVVPPEDE